MRPHHIYKIFRPSEWDDFTNSGLFTGSLDDKRDGFIHFSTLVQVPGTLDKYYTDKIDVIIAQILSQDIEKDLKYETSRGGMEFPHLYADLNIETVNQYWLISARDDGSYDIAEILEPTS